MENGYKLVTTTDGRVYFGKQNPIMISGESVRLKECCMLYMYGIEKPPLDIAALGFTEDDNINITQCVSDVSIFNHSLCVDVSDKAVESILGLITHTRNQELANLAGTDK